MSVILRQSAENPGMCPMCNGIGSSIRVRDNDPHTPIDMPCAGCQGSGHQSERQIVINKGVNAAILGAMPAQAREARL